MRIALKRVYEEPSTSDGKRILVERLWPRGLSKENAMIDFWARDTAPSHELRKWFNHDPERWIEFKEVYFAELDGNEEAVTQLRELCADDMMTFVFASKEEALNNAFALKEYLIQHI